ncbi:MAG: energy-coupling factor transporter transmembrane protein EcfT [Coriobacteriales bacterium]|jgi:energy-coupling factor transport system permease protein|nr:energy-coupling factor transporter transmembrane protein EcfT [Coriobacteriales bacterium]
MALVVPFGQYVPGTTPVHRLDARVKLLLVALMVFALFACHTWIGLLTCTGLLLASFASAHIPPRLMLRGLKPVWIILTFTFLANALTFAAIDNASHVAIGLPGLDLTVPESVALIGSFGIRPLGVLLGLYFALRITILVCLTSLLTYTTSVVSLADALSSLLAPLRVLRVPVEDISMMFTIALRFIPLTAEEAEKLIVAQSARGAVFNQGGPLKRIKAYMPVMVPLFVNLFRRADQLAQAMESRCYRGQGRTRLKTVRISRPDVLTALIATLVLLAIGILL